MLPTIDHDGIHESSHAVIATLIGSPVAYVTVRGGQPHMRYQKHVPPPPTPANVAGELAVCVSGEIAEVIAEQMGEKRDISTDRGLNTETVDFRNAMRY